MQKDLSIDLFLKWVKNNFLSYLLKQKMKKNYFLVIVLILLISCVKERDSAEPVLKKINHLDAIDPTIEFDTPLIVEKDDRYIFRRILSGKDSASINTKDFTIPKSENVEFTIFVQHKNKDYNDFKVRLNPDKNFNTPDVWQTDNQILAISDIEGEFYAFVDLLTKAKVIDKNYKWIFGNNHLVLLGDFFDRGDMVHECLWLLYKLESEGANIHYIHGNHDIMNISGNQTNYIRDKYFKSLKAVGYNKIEEFYKPTTVLGKWLRSKNVLEQGNDILFLHAGISKNLIAQYPDLTVNYANTVTKNNFDTPKSPESIAFLSGKNSLTWFRGYFGKSPKHYQVDVDFILNHFNASMICVGHTTQTNADLFFNGKVGCTDVNFHQGSRQALLFDKGSVYRLDASEGKSYEVTKLK